MHAGASPPRTAVASVLQRNAMLRSEVSRFVRRCGLIAGVASLMSCEAETAPSPTECPATRPTFGSACEGDLTCYYGFTADCVGGGGTTEYHVCADGRWAPQTTGGCGPEHVPTCPAQQPELGSYCDSTLRCFYDELFQCPDGVSVRFTRNCVNRVWTLNQKYACEEDPCPGAPPAIDSPCTSALYCGYGEQMDCTGGSTIGYLRACLDGTWEGLWDGTCKTVCPDAPPEPGLPCSPDELACAYATEQADGGTGTKDHYVCVDGFWTRQDASSEG